jgi:tRNA-splicing ligase RtcB (3'-phosphate/5'-hydroxy nucleic acid ligase)
MTLLEEKRYSVFQDGGMPVKAWIRGVELEDEAKQQVLNLSRLPFIHKHIALMPDVHAGIGSTIGSVIATTGAIIPAAVGVDIGCGMTALQTNIKADQLPGDLSKLRSMIIHKLQPLVCVKG